MKKYDLSFIMLGLLILCMCIFIPVHHMVTSMAVLLGYSVLSYLLLDNKNVKFLSKFKYLLITIVLTYFFIIRNRDGGYWGVDETVIFFSDVIALVFSVFFVYVLIRIDRLLKYKGQKL